MVGIGALRGLKRTRLINEPDFPLKPTKVGFIFIGPNSFSQAEDLSIPWHKLSLDFGQRMVLQ